MTLQDKIDEYLETRVAYDAAHAISSEQYGKHQGAKSRLVEFMLLDNQQSVKFGDGPLTGMSFFLKQRFAISCNADNEEDIKAWLHDRYGDVHEFTAEKVVKRAVEERLKNDIEGEQLDEFDVPEFMNLKTRPDVSCTGFKQFSAEARK